MLINRIDAQIISLRKESTLVFIKVNGQDAWVVALVSIQFQFAQRCVFSHPKILLRLSLHPWWRIMWFRFFLLISIYFRLIFIKWFKYQTVSIHVLKYVVILSWHDSRSVLVRWCVKISTHLRKCQSVRLIWIKCLKRLKLNFIYF